ncbi:MAG: thioredoxin family protein [Chloroflexota bacterium]
MAKPVVDGLERDLADRATVVRLNVGEDVGRSVANRYGLGAVPTFMVFRGGSLTERTVGFPDRDRLMRALLNAEGAR